MAPSKKSQKPIGPIKKGALHKALGIKAGNPIPAAKMAAAAKKARPGSKMRRRIQFVKNMNNGKV